MKDLADYLQRIKVLKTPEIISAFKKIDRKDFVPPELLQIAYQDSALPIGYGQTISQPYTVAFMLELLQPRAGMRILDIGSGSGWQTALLASIAGKQGQVYAMEIIPELLTRSEESLKKYGFTNIKYILGSAWETFPEKVIFDRIIVAAAAPKIPQALKEVLAVGGKIVLPLGGASGQDLVLVEKVSVNNYQRQHYPGFIFVPLVK